jgi:cytoskeletal protein CcmA (bactofilin family)
MSKGPMMPFGGGKARPAEPERVIEPSPPPARAAYQPPQRVLEPAAPPIRTVLGQGCIVEGKLVCVGPTQLDGKVTGELVADDLLIVDRNANILADLNVQEVIVRGAVKGNIHAKRRVTLEETAQVEGDVSAPAVEMKIGAQMSGKIDVIHKAREAAPAPSTQYQPHAHQPTPAYHQQPTVSSQPAPAPQPAPREPSHAFVAFDDSADRSGF